MCLLIYKPADKPIPEDHLKTAWESNGDGAGLAWPSEQNNIIRIKKGFMKHQPLIQSIASRQQSELLIHLRFATHGLKDSTNTHPFRINEHLVFAHNGVLTEMPKEKERSDTRIFVEDVIRPLLGTQKEVHPWQLLILEMALGRDKGLIMGPTTSYILNESLGSWEGGIWYSNTTYKTKKFRNYTTYNPKNTYLPVSTQNYWWEDELEKAWDDQYGDKHGNWPDTPITHKPLGQYVGTRTPSQSGVTDKFVTQELKELWYECV